MPTDLRQTSIALRSDRERGRPSLVVLAVVGMLPGLVEIELDEVSPAILIARAAGRLLERSEPR